MPRPRSAVRKIREVLRLGLGEGLTARQVAGAVGIPRTTAHRYLTRAAAAGVGWPLPEDLDDVQLERRLFGRPGITVTTRPVPDWATIHLELKRKGVTLQLLWDEDRQTHPDGYQYSQWCLHYHRWARRLDLVMRQDHRAGEKLFVDFAGPTVPVVSTHRPARSPRPRSSSRSWAPATSPTPKPWSPRRSRTGSAPIVSRHSE